MTSAIAMPAAARPRTAGRRTYTVPSQEERDRLLAEFSATDPQPDRCPEHTDSTRSRTHCAVCGEFTRWRKRMFRRFNVLGLSYQPDRPPLADNPEPPPCPEGHGFKDSRNTCVHCRARRNWLERRGARRRRHGIPNSVRDLTDLIAHVTLLRERGMSSPAIARAAKCGHSAVRRLLNNEVDEHSYVQLDVAARLRAIPVPERELELVPDAAGVIRHRVAAIGTQRRMQAACRAGHNIASQAERIGYGRTTGYGWLQRSAVAVDVADRIAELFPTLIARPVDDPHAVAFAIRNGWLEARYFSADNIDDPGYDPFAFLTDTTGLTRQLRALARIGQGPQQVAAYIGEPVENVTLWLKGGPVPAYARHLVAAAYAALAATPGPDQALARQAHRKAWLPPTVWRHGPEIDDPGLDPYAPVPACHGGRRRLRAMAWMGHGPRQIAGHLGERASRVRAWLLGDESIPWYALPLIEDLYEWLSGDFGPDQAIAATARRFRWDPPLAWEYIDMDNPRAWPHYGLPPGDKKTDHPLDSQVHLALLGRIPQSELLHVERVKAVRALHRAGWSDRQIAAWLRWNETGDLDKGLAAVARFRLREGITGHGPNLKRPSGREIVTPPAA